MIPPSISDAAAAPRTLRDKSGMRGTQEVGDGVEGREGGAGAGTNHRNSELLPRDGDRAQWRREEMRINTPPPPTSLPFI